MIIINKYKSKMTFHYNWVIFNPRKRQRDNDNSRYIMNKDYDDV